MDTSRAEFWLVWRFDVFEAKLLILEAMRIAFANFLIEDWVFRSLDLYKCDRFDY